MKALFLKEWRQNYLLFLFSLIMVGFIPGMYALLHVTWVRNWRDQVTLDETMGIVYLGALFIIVLFGGAGLIAGETERGTLPVLLGLPLSRARVWLAKLAAGFTMTVCGLVLVLGTSVIVLPQCLDAVNWPKMWRDLSVFLTLGFFLGFFWSAVLNRTISALLATIVSGPALFFAAAIYMTLFGASLYGHDTFFDAWLWMLSTTPGMLLGSYMTFARSGIEASRGRWRTALAWTAVGVFVTGALIVGVVRWGTRYRRSQVVEIATGDLPSDGTAIALSAQGDRVSRSTSRYRGYHEEYRSQHTVVVDLKTGRDLLVRRGRARVAAVSRDGKVVALGTAFATLTWRSRELDMPEVRGVEIWDLAQGKRLYHGLPSEFWKQGRMDIRKMEWSPDGEWLLMGADIWQSAFDQAVRFRPPGEPGFRSEPRALLLMQRDGTQPRVVEACGGIYGQRFTYAWDPSPGAHAVYAFSQDGSLHRHDLDTGLDETVWQGPFTEDQESALGIEGASLAVSPDGGSLAAAIVASAFPSGGWEDIFVFLVPTHATSALPSAGSLVWSWREVSTFSSLGLLLSWSPEGRDLCAAAVGSSRGSDVWTLRAMRWELGSKQPRVGEPAAAHAGGTAARRTVWLEGLVALPGRDQFLVWSQRDTWLVDENAQLQSLPGNLRPLERGDFFGFDAQGRAILNVHGERGSHIAALDVSSGKLTHIYP